MALQTVGVIYSLNQLVRRQTIVPSMDDSELQPFKDMLPDGCGWLDVHISFFYALSVEEFDEFIATQIGNAHSDRCAVIYGEDVVAVIKADPSVDEHPEGILIQDDTAEVGDTYDFENGVPVKPDVPPVDVGEHLDN